MSFVSLKILEVPGRMESATGGRQRNEQRLLMDLSNRGALEKNDSVSQRPRPAIYWQTNERLDDG